MMRNTNKYMKRNPIETANLISRLFFWWTIKLLRKSNRDGLSTDNLYAPLLCDESDSVTNKLEKSWNYEIEKSVSEGKSKNYNGCKMKLSNPNFISAILRTFWQENLYIGLLLLFQAVILRIVQPICQARIISFFNSRNLKHPTTQNEALSYAGALITTTLGVIFIVHHMNVKSQQLGMKIRVSCCSLIYRKTIAIVIHLHERDVVFESVSSFAICLAFAVKYMNVVCSADMIKELWETIRRDWKSLLNDKEKRSLQFESNLGHFFSTGYAVFAYVSATIFVTEPIFPKILSIFVKTNETVPLKLALPLEYLFIDLEHHYWILYIVSTICIYNTIFIIISCDILFITFVQHVCGLFAVIGCAKYIEDAYTWSNGILAILNAPVISITSFLLITEATTIDQTLKYATFTLCQVSHLFYLCFMAQKLEDMSLRINENIKNAPWYNNSIKAQKLLLLMSMRSQVPCKLTACKIMDLSIANFAAVIKTSASYITMLLQTQ